MLTPEWGGGGGWAEAYVMGTEVSSLDSNITETNRFIQLKFSFSELYS